MDVRIGEKTEGLGLEEKRRPSLDFFAGGVELEGINYNIYSILIEAGDSFIFLCRLQKTSLGICTWQRTHVRMLKKTSKHRSLKPSWERDPHIQFLSIDEIVVGTIVEHIYIQARG